MKTVIAYLFPLFGFQIKGLIFSQLGKNYFPVREDLLPNWGRKFASPPPSPIGRESLLLVRVPSPNGEG